MSDAINKSAFAEAERAQKENMVHRRMTAFFNCWAPEDPRSASEFHAEFFMLVREIYADAAKPHQDVLMKLVAGRPFPSPIIPKE